MHDFRVAETRTCNCIFLKSDGKLYGVSLLYLTARAHGENSHLAEEINSMFDSKDPLDEESEFGRKVEKSEIAKGTVSVVPNSKQSRVLSRSFLRTKTLNCVKGKDSSGRLFTLCSKNSFTFENSCDQLSPHQICEIDPSAYVKPELKDTRRVKDLHTVDLAKVDVVFEEEKKEM